MARRPARPTTPIEPASPCPCGLGQAYRDCCGRLHRGETPAATAELLMRSRFSAYAVHDGAYLLRTWHSTARPRRLRFDPDLHWTRLEIVSRTAGGLLDAEGTVEFRAHYVQDGQAGEMREHSRFMRENGLWVYLGPIAAPGSP